MNPVEDEVVSKLEVNKKKRVLNEICDWVSKDREVAIFVMFYFLEMTYKEIAEKLELPDGIKEAKKLKMRGERKLRRKYPSLKCLDAMKD